MTNLLGDVRKSTTARSRALTGVALSAATLAMVVPGYAQAQQSGEVQEITITGSRIKAPNLTSDSPVNAVSAEEIHQSNTPSIENVLNSLPSVATDLTSTTSSLGPSTTASVNLRDLGVTRTLVLIDGRRIGPGDPTGPTGAAADLNFIPMNLVQGVDVLTGGASAIYGSDAIAGVVNFHLVRDFQGAQLDFSYTAAQHDNNNSDYKAALVNTANLSPGYNVSAVPKSNFDGFIRDTSGMVGANSSDGKGNVTLYADYRATTPVANNTRDYSACPIYPTTSGNKPQKFCAGSSTNPHGKFPDLPGAPPGNLSNNGNGTATFVPFSGTFEFNFAGTSFLQRQDDRAALGAIGHYEINPHVDIYSEMMFMNDQSLQQDGAGGLFVDGVPGIQTTLTIPCTNPYIGHTAGPTGISQYTALGCAAGVASTTINFPGLRFTLPRQTENTHDDYRALAGVRGDIDGNWSYDVSASHWQSDYTLKDVNWANLPLVDAAVANGTLNIFQYGGDTVAQQQAVSAPALETGQNQENDVTASISGDLGPYGGKSPWASNPVAVAGGVEYRHDTLSLQPDYAFTSGYVLGGNQVLPINGGETSVEEFGEIRAPLIQDQPYIRALDLDLAMRHADYTVDNSGNAFSTNTWKISSDYAPTDDFRLRGGFNRAARAPNVYELFLGDSYGTDSGYIDPCATGEAQYRTACTTAPGKAGVTLTQFNNGSILQCSASQCNNYIGGNTALKPEEADTWTWGINLTPTFLPGFNASIDYWDVKINGYINNGYPGSDIVNGCYAGQTFFCQFISRDPVNGGLVGNGKVIETNTNLDQLHDRGLDLDLNYTKKIDELGLGIENMGSLNFHMTGTYLISAVTQIADSIKAYDCSGEYGATCYSPQPVWRHQARLTWNTPWDADISVNWRFIAGSSLDADDPKNPAYGSLAGDCDGGITCGGLDSHINNYNYFDLSGSYRLWDKYTVRAGVNNLFDKDPPMLNQEFGIGIGGSGGGNNGNLYTMYDSLGRVMFVSFSAKW